MTPEESQILVPAELPHVPATAVRKPITDCNREDLAFAIDDYYRAAASRVGQRPTPSRPA